MTGMLALCSLWPSQGLLTEPAMPIQMITTGSFLSSCPSLGCGVVVSGAGAVVDAAVEDSAMLKNDSFC